MSSSIVPEILDPQLKLRMLLAHAALGRRLLPTAWIVDGQCSCAVGTDKTCVQGNKAGKHPLIGQWQNRATCDPEEIIGLHTWKPMANWGWLQDQTFALDVDPKRGGLDSLTQWEENAGGPNTTMTQRTQSGGWHFIYTQPEGGIRTEGDMLPGIELRATGAYIMLEPSVGLEGRWEIVNHDVRPCEADDLIYQLIAKHCLDFSLGDGDGVERRGGRGRKKRSEDTGPKLPATEYFLKAGFGSHTGSRNKDAYSLMWRLLAYADSHPETYTIQHIREVMHTSWLATDQGDAPFTWDECVGLMNSAYKRRERQKVEDEDQMKAFARSLAAQR